MVALHDDGPMHDGWGVVMLHAHALQKYTLQHPSAMAIWLHYQMNYMVGDGSDG